MWLTRRKPVVTYPLFLGFTLYDCVHISVFLLRNRYLMFIKSAACTQSLDTLAFVYVSVLFYRGMTVTVLFSFYG